MIMATVTALPGAGRSVSISMLAETFGVPKDTCAIATADKYAVLNISAANMRASDRKMVPAIIG